MQRNNKIIKFLSKYYEINNSQRFHCVDHPLLGNIKTELALRVVCIPSETLLERTRFSLTTQISKDFFEEIFNYFGTSKRNYY